jgi:hypothetical protein
VPVSVSSPPNGQRPELHGSAVKLNSYHFGSKDLTDSQKWTPIRHTMDDDLDKTSEGIF